MWSSQSPGRGAISSEEIEGDEWGAYVTLGHTSWTNVGSPNGREPRGDAGLVVVVGVTPHGEGGKAVRRAKGAR
jgi:hypothetical protein